MYLSHFDTVK